MNWKLMGGLVLSGLSGLMLVNMVGCLFSGELIAAALSFNGSAVLSSWAYSIKV